MNNNTKYQFESPYIWDPEDNVMTNNPKCSLPSYHSDYDISHKDVPQNIEYSNDYGYYIPFCNLCKRGCQYELDFKKKNGYEQAYIDIQKKGLNKCNTIQKDNMIEGFGFSNNYMWGLLLILIVLVLVNCK
jgi:hypothetical protein